MHFDKSAKEKPGCTLLTVKKLLEEQRRKRETSSEPASCSTTSSSLVPLATVPQISSSESFACAGAASSYSDMAVSYEPWPPASDPTLSYYSREARPSYDPTYSFPMPAEYCTHQQVPGLGDTLSQTYQCPMTVTDPSMTSSWSLPCTSQTTQLGFGPSIDATKLEEARMLLNTMEYSRTTCQDEDGDTILHIYTAKGLRECAFAAAERLRDVGGLDAKEHKGKTALMVAVTANQTAIVQDLLSLGADINAWDVKGQTALHLAAHYGFPEVLQTILTCRPSVNLELRDFEGMTALHCAAISHSVTMKALSTAGMADINLQTKAADNLSCVQMLHAARASLLSQEIKSNKTVLHLAVKEGNIVLVHFLLKIPLPNMKDFVNMKAHGHTALHMAAGLHDSPHQEEILQLLLSRGADPSIRNLENDQPAHLLQSGPRGEQLKRMLKKRNASRTRNK